MNYFHPGLLLRDRLQIQIKMFLVLKKKWLNPVKDHHKHGLPVRRLMRQASSRYFPDPEKEQRDPEPGLN